jgi:hypothetical protein
MFYIETNEQYENEMLVGLCFETPGSDITKV